jgi:hypothetical protein
VKWIKFILRLTSWRYHFPKKGTLAYRIKHSNPGTKIYIAPAKYTEDLSLKKGVDIRGMD